MDMFNDLMNKVLEEEEKQRKIVEKVSKMDFPYKNILYKEYIQGKSLVTVASEMHYNYEYTKRLKGEALNKFDKIGEEE